MQAEQFKDIKLYACIRNYRLQFFALTQKKRLLLQGRRRLLKKLRI